MDFYTTEELHDIGFSKVGREVKVSKHTAFYNISGEIGSYARVDAFAILTGNIFLGEKTHVSPYSFLSASGGKIVLEKGAGVSTHVSLFTKSDDYADMSIGQRPKIVGDIQIGEYSILGAQCVVLPGVNIGKNCSIGLGCVIHENIQDASRLVSMGIKTVKLA